MNLDIVKRILTKMQPKHTGVPGNEEFTAWPYQFYEFEEMSTLPRNEYEALIVEMGRQGWISIDFKGSGPDDRYVRAKISETKAGFLYLQKLASLE